MCATHQFPGSPQKGTLSAYRVLVALGLILALGWANAHSQNPPAGQQGSSIESLTLNLVNLNARYHAAGPASDSQLLSELQSAAASRQQVLAALMESDPAAVLPVAIPSNISNTMPPTVRNYVEKDTAAQGVLEVVAEMQGLLDNPTAVKVHYGLQLASGRLVLHFASNPPTHLQTGSTVHVKGVQVGNALALASGSDTTSFGTVAQSSAGSVGAQSTVVLMVYFQNNPIQPFTVAAADSTFFTGSPNASQQFLEMSYGQAWLTGNVYGWLPVSIGETCDYNAIASAVQSAAQAHGLSLSAYIHQVYIFPTFATISCTWGGLGTVGGNPSQAWLPSGSSGPALSGIRHEMGHNLGLYHAHGWDCAGRRRTAPAERQLSMAICMTQWAAAGITIRFTRSN